MQPFVPADNESDADNVTVRTASEVPSISEHPNTTHISFCEWEHMAFGSHHKTGTFLIRDLHLAMQAVSNRICHHATGVFMPHISKEQLMGFAANQRVYVVNMIRNPVDIVLSGYNYHLHTQNMGEWVNGKHSVDQLMSQEWHTFLNKKYGFMRRFGNTMFFEDMEHMHRLIAANCDTLNISRANCTYQVMLNHLSLEDGLHMEFNKVRYWSGYGCIAELVSSYRYVREQSNSNWVAVTYRLEDFESNYTLQLHDVLRRMGVDEHRDADLWDAVVRQVSNQSNHADEQLYKEHVTRNTYNRSNEVRVLLTEPMRCAQLKNWTALLGYAWKHVAYC